VDWTQARTYCQWSGGRLPSEAQWEKAARGTDRRNYPWGDSLPDRGLLNFNQNVKDTTEVGSYPTGASPYGIMDMAGNVWEWTNDWYDEYYYQNSPSSNPQGPENGQLRVLRGGSWHDVSGTVRVAHRDSYNPENWSRGSGDGFRCVRSIDIVSSTLSPEPQKTMEQIPTVTNMSEMTLTPESKTRISEKDGMEQVYIQEGEFLMGSTDNDSEANNNERPQHKVYLDAFWIDKTEVTNAMFKKCTLEGICSGPRSIGTYTRSSYFGNTAYANYPVINVDWRDAKGYCSWAGGRLPSEAEWEKAARGTDGRKYPWGNEVPDSNLLNYNGSVIDTTEVGSYPSGASLYGVMDMAGNVWEWVNDWYDESYYLNSPARNPTGPESGKVRVLRGGGWKNEANYVRIAYRGSYVPDNWFSVRGFRCVHQ